MSKIKFLFVCLFASTFSLHAQYTRISVDFYTGSPLPLTFFTPTLAPFGGLSVKYSLLKEISVAGNISVGSMTGKNTSANVNFIYPDNINNYTNFSNQFFQYTLEGQLNLESLLGLRRFLHQLNPFIIFGGGMIYSGESAIRTDGKGERSYLGQNFYTAYVGLNFKYYLNPTLDLTFGTSFNNSQTPYLDAVPLDKSLDNYLFNYVGVSYKIGARKDYQHIEWNNVILKDRIYIPDIEKHIGQPFDAAGTLFLFNKDTINKIIAQNTELKNKSQQLEKRTNQLEADNINQQKQIDSIQNEITAIKTVIDTLKNPSATDKIVEKSLNQELQIIANNSKKVTPKIEKQIDQSNRNTERENTIAERPQNNQHIIEEYKTQIVKKQSTDKQINIDKTIAETEPSRSHQIKKVNSDRLATASNVKSIPSNKLTDGLNKINTIASPVAKYNIIVAVYAGNKYATSFRNKLRAKGFHAAAFKSSANSKMTRVCIFTTEDKKEAIKVLNKVRNEIEPEAWIHVFYRK